MSQKQQIQSRYFLWRLSQRNNVWQADGRSNNLNAGRHSLGTRDLTEAQKIVHKLDEKMAAELGVIRFARRQDDVNFRLTIDDGICLYRSHINRPRVAGGVKSTTRKRYERAIKSFERFVESNRLQYWEQFDADYLNSFAKNLELKCTPSSVATAVSIIKTIHKHLIESKQLDERCSFKYLVAKAKESTRYCPTEAEMREILGRLAADASLRWIYDVTAVLSHSGMRFGELAQLTRYDIDLEQNVIHIRDESFDPSSSKSTKTGHSRTVPMHPVVRAIMDQRLSNDKDQLFCGPRGGTLRSDTFGRNLKSKALTPLATKFPHPRFLKITAHCLRHFFAAVCAANKVSEQTTMDWMGHRTSNMARYYYHSNHQAGVDMIQQFNSFTEVPTVDSASHTTPEENGNTDIEPKE